MKFLFAAVLALHASNAHAGEGTPIYRANCFIDDMTKDLNERSVADASIALKSGESAVVGTYRGISLEVNALDLTRDSDTRPRRQVTFNVRKAAKNKILVSILNAYSLEQPKVLLSTPDGVMYRCFPTNL